MVPVPPYLMNPYHPITIDVIGVGGNGSQVLIALAKLSWALKETGRMPLYVTAWDPDIISPSNVVRQQFYPPDIGKSKSKILIERINRSYGYNWKAYSQKYNERLQSNIVISCVDKYSIREEISIGILNQIKNYKKSGNQADVNYFWIDLGNDNVLGQIIMGSYQKDFKMDTIVDYVKKNKIDINPFEDEMLPSCSAQESINAQGLYLNALLGTLTGQLLWEILTGTEIKTRGYFVNLESGRMSKISV